MKHTHLLYSLLALFIASLTVQLKAQNYRDFSLTSHYGLGIDETYASGGSPLIYGGLAAKIGLDFQAEWQHLQIACAQQLNCGMGMDSQSDNLNIPIGYTGKIHLLYREQVPADRRFQWKAGGGIGNRFSLLYNSGLGNASMAAFNFMDLDLCSQISYRFSFWKKLFSAYTNICLPFFSWIRMPGFLYMSDYVMGKDIFILSGKTYENHFHFLTGISTEIGISHTLPNQNRIACSYFWDYCSSGKTDGCDRFDHAQHFLQCSFSFNLKHNE